MNKSASVAFTGHRNLPPCQIPRIKEKLQKTITILYAQGYRTFLCGMAIGFDLLAAEVLQEAKLRFPELRIVACIPFIGQELRFSESDRQRYAFAVSHADERIIISRTYNKKSYILRNLYMLENSSVLVAFFDQNIRMGGTFFTYNKAIAQSKCVINLY